MTNKLYIFSILLLFNLAWANIIHDENGNQFLTLGSTQDEVIEILGTPTKVYSNFFWAYGWETIKFDQQGKISGYSNAESLKIKLVSKSYGIHSSLSKDDSSKIESSTTSYSNYPTSGYGEISKTTGRPRTKPVSGYYRKDGTYVKPYYRSL